MSDMQKTAPDKYKDTVCFLRHDGQGRTQNQREAVMEFVISYRRSVVTQTKNGWIFLPELAFVAWHVYKEGLKRSDAKILWKRAIEHEKVPKREDSQGRICVGVRKHMEFNFLDNIESITVTQAVRNVNARQQCELAHRAAVRMQRNDSEVLM